jgi:hypothetical protein
MDHTASFDWLINHLICNHFSRKVVLEIWFEKSGSRNLVREIWFEKSGSRKVVLKTRIFFSGSRKVVDQKKKWVYTINPPSFRLEKSGSANHFSRTTFLHIADLNGQRHSQRSNNSGDILVFIFLFEISDLWRHLATFLPFF